MGKKGGTRRYFSKEYKLSVVKRNIEGESSGKLSKELGVDKSLICHWARAYRDKGEIGLETKRHPGNPLLTYQKRKQLSTEDQLRYELAKKDIELAKLKKLLEYQGGMSAKAAETVILQSHIGIKQSLRNYLAMSGIWCITVGILQLDTP